METSTRLQDSNLISSLDMFISGEARFNNLFKGGCVMTGAVLTRELEKRGIPYKVAVYCGLILPDMFAKNLKLLAKIGGINHMSIEVDGRPIGNNRSYERAVDEGMVSKRYYDIKSDEIQEIYDNNSWNDEWDTNQNQRIEEHVKQIFSIF